jgi:hypothetical protein
MGLSAIRETVAIWASEDQMSIQERKQLRAYRAQFGTGDDQETEHQRLWDQMIANVERPFWEREPMGEGWIEEQTDKPLLLMITPNFTEAAIRNDHAVARLRLCRALIALRLGESTDDIIDPFTGEPLRIRPDIIYSLGPDRSDDEGQTRYDPTNGTVSSGDLVVSR